jgi:hypothetical protein
MPEAGEISKTEQEEIDTDMLRDRPFYHILINSLEVYDQPKQGKFMKWYNGLMGNPDGYNKTAKFVCWDKTIFSRKLITWSLKENGDINTNEWGDVDDKYRNKTDFSVPIDWTKLFYCLTMKLFLFPIPQVLFIAYRFLSIFLSVIIKALVVIFAAVGNTLNKLGEGLNKTRILIPIGMTIQYGTFIILNILQVLLKIIGFIFGSSKHSKLNVGENTDLVTGYTSYSYSFTYKKIVNVDGTGEEQVVIPNFTDIIYAYLGIVLPIGQINPEFGVKYGSGGLGILILLIMAISAVVIFVGGSSITVAFIGFLMYIFKVIKMLGDFKTEDKGKSSSKEAEK